MEIALAALVAFGASLLTFFSGFGLGTLLLPVFALFFSVPEAVALTAIVHLLNNVFKLALVGRHMHRNTLLAFGLASIPGAVLGAWALRQMAEAPPVTSYVMGGQVFDIYPANIIIGILLLVFSLFELMPVLKRMQFPSGMLPVGGLLSGFFGGLSGFQGALRSAFMVRLGLTPAQFVATGVAIAVLVDLARISQYMPMFRDATHDMWQMVTVAVGAAFAGALLGKYYLKKITIQGIQVLVGILLLLLSFAIMMGLIG